MLVPDLSPPYAPRPVSVFPMAMVPMMTSASTFRGFLGPSPPLHVHPLHHYKHPMDVLQYPEPCSRPRNPASVHGLNVPSLTSHVGKSDASVSPASSENGSCLSPLSEKSHVRGSSEEYEMANEDGSMCELNSERKAFKCPQCLYFTDRKNNLKRHIVTMHQECSKTLECCGVMFHSKAALRDHVGLFHRGGYRCQICSRNFCRKALLRRHLTVHSGRKDFSCNMCGYATSHKSNLERHQKVHIRRPSCSPMRDTNRMPFPHLDVKPTPLYFPRFMRARERTYKRFSLLPNRIKHTHNTQSYLEGVIASTCVQDDSQMMPTLLTSASESAGCPEDAGLDETQDSPRTTKETTPRSRASRSRLFGTPYKCSDCSKTFSRQAEYQEHQCKLEDTVVDTGLSVITAVRKGKIRLLSQTQDKDS